MGSSCYIKVVLLLFNVLLQSLGLHVFWELRSNKSDCLEEETLLKIAVRYPSLCYQAKYNSSSPLNIEKCVEKILCKNKKDINHEKIAHCATKDEMLCCINEDQCEDKDHKNNENECKAMRDTERKKNRVFGNCKFPFIYKSKSYYKCTTIGYDSLMVNASTENESNNCYRWCATMVNENNVFIENSGLWGHCSNQCDVNYDETCKKKRKGKKQKASRHKGKHKKEKQNSRAKKKQEHKFPRFKKEHETEIANPRPMEIEHQCWTRNTTTSVKNIFDGTYQDHTLVNPGKCIFPFNYKGTWYSNCIAVDDPMCRLWCSVQNDRGYHRKQGSKWAYCNEAGCNMNKPESEYYKIGPKCYLEKDNSNKAQNHFFEWELTKVEFIESEDPNFNYYDMDNSNDDD